MKKTIVTILALLATAALFYAFPFRAPREAEGQKGVSITRVWIAEEEAALSPWLRKMAAAYEKETGKRVYLRSAAKAEAQAALQNATGVVPPDVLMGQGLKERIAWQGYALFVRDEAAEKSTPAPTSALFIRPSPPPQASPSPAPTPGREEIASILVPEGWPASLENAVAAKDVMGAFEKGQATAAVLTAGQAEKLPFAVRAFALPDGLRPLTARAFTGPGEAFLAFLKEEAAQRALAAAGLYSVRPGLVLYDAAAQPVRAMIEGARPHQQEAGTAPDGALARE